MKLLGTIYLTDAGEMTVDDGRTAWRASVVTLRVGTHFLSASVHVEQYRGSVVVDIEHESMKLPDDLATRLAAIVYRVSHQVLIEDSAVSVEMRVDLAPLVAQCFEQHDAMQLLKQLYWYATGSRPWLN